MAEDIRLRIVFNLDGGSFHQITAFHLENAEITGAQHSNGRGQEHTILLQTAPITEQKNNLTTIAIAINTAYQGFKPRKKTLLHEEKNGQNLLVLEIYN